MKHTLTPVTALLLVPLVALPVAGAEIINRSLL